MLTNDVRYDLYSRIVQLTDCRGHNVDPILTEIRRMAMKGLGEIQQAKNEASARRQLARTFSIGECKNG